jgi:glycosyltransferase involved in cell wall biosynthesis
MTGRPPGDWRELVVICATTPWDGNRLLDRHVATQLSRYAPILYVDPPVSPVSRGGNSAERRVRDRLEVVEPSIARLTPVVLPAKERPLVKQASLALTRRAMRRAVSALGSPPVRAVIVPSLNPLFGACGEQVRVFYAKDDYVAGAGLMRIDPRRLRRRARRQPADADIVVAASPQLAEHYRTMGHAPLLIPNGVDAAAFAGTDTVVPAADVTLRPPIVGLVGHLSDRIDVGLVEAVAGAGHSVLLVGPQAALDRDRWTALFARPNVQVIGPRPFEELPSYFRHIDVGIVPYSDSAFNRASFPLKTLEYLAAGRAVVASDLPAVRWLETDLIAIADGPRQFADAVARSLAVARTPELVQRRRAFAAAHSWESRVEVLAAALGFPQPRNLKQWTLSPPTATYPPKVNSKSVASIPSEGA